MLNSKSFLETLNQHNPAAIEEAFFSMLLKAIGEHEVILLDDDHSLRTAFCENHMYQRNGLLDGLLTELCDYADALNKKIILCIASDIPDVIVQRTYYARLKQYGEEDYQCLCRAFLHNSPLHADRLNYPDIFRVVG